MKRLLVQTWEALFLSPTPYAEMRDGEKGLLRGLQIVLMIAFAIALLGLIGTTLEWATTPNLEAMKETVRRNLVKMSWYDVMRQNSEAEDYFEQYYDLGWRIFPAMFGFPSIGGAALSIVILPIQLLIGWLLYGVLAHLAAKIFGGQGTMGQTLGCTALAMAPQLLNLISLVPYASVGGVVGTWVLLCRYLALKTCHRLTWQKALAVTLLPSIILGLVVGLFLIVGIVVAALVGGGMSA